MFLLFFSLFPTFFIFPTVLTVPAECVETSHALILFIQFTSPEISGIFISIPIQHFFDVTTLASIHLVENIQRNKEKCVDEDDDAFGASCSNRYVFLNLSDCSLFPVSDPLLPTWTFLIMFPSCVSSSPPSAPRSQVDTFPAPRSTRARFLSFTRSVSAILSLHAFILVLFVKVLSMIVLLRSRHSLLCG